MAKSRRRKRPRGSRGEPTSAKSTTTPKRTACDLMVALPKDVDTKVHAQLLVRSLIDRLASTGYSHMALTHTIYGRPRTGEDDASNAIPAAIWSLDAKEPAKKKRKVGEKTSKHQEEPSTRSPLKVLRRLHAVVENLSDVGSYMASGPDAALLQEYDIISVAPRNEATFQSACASATACDIITLDYSGSRGLKLPFRIRPADVQAIVDRNMAFEILFGPAILTTKHRKALVQTCLELQMASLGKKPLVLFSSGDRTVEERDVGAMVLRLPGDLSNLMQVLLKFDPSISNRAVGPAALDVIAYAQERRWGKTEIAEISVGSPHDFLVMKDVDSSKVAPTSSLSTRESPDNKNLEDEEGGPEDGFISMT